MTPLHWAVQNEHLDVVSLLLRHGGNPDVVNKFDKTPLDIAVDLNRMDILQELQVIHMDPPIITGDLQVTLEAEEEYANQQEQPQQNEEGLLTEKFLFLQYIFSDDFLSFAGLR